MKRKRKPALKLNRETLRNLATDELESAHGGQLTGSSCGVAGCGCFSNLCDATNRPIATCIDCPENPRQ